MKMLLQQNIKKLGSIGDIVDVKKGYARNYLIPQGLAIEPTQSNIKRVEEAKAEYLEELAKQKEQLQIRAQRVNGKEITIPARANEEGHLYGSIGPAQIVAALTAANCYVEQDNIMLDEPIRRLDKYEVVLRFDENVTATVGVWVVPIREEDQPQPRTAETVHEPTEIDDDEKTPIAENEANE